MLDHQRLIQRAPTDAASRGNRFFDGPRPSNGIMQCFTSRASAAASCHGWRARIAWAASPSRQRTLASLRKSRRTDSILATSCAWVKVGLKSMAMAGWGHHAEGGAQLIDRAALDAIAGDEKFAGGGGIAGADGDVFQGFAFGCGEHFRRPRMFPSAIGRDQRMAGDAESFKKPRPCAVGAGLRPRAAAEREDHRIRRDGPPLANSSRCGTPGARPVQRWFISKRTPRPFKRAIQRRSREPP